MDINSIRAFLAVSETESFSRAASNLHLTQPAVSKRIQSMEQFLDIKLFDRIGKQVRLTEAGREILPSCNRILAELEESQRIISNLRDSTRGVLSLATSHHIGLHRLPPVLREFTRLYPDVELDVNFMDSEKACAAVLSGELELAVATLPSQAKHNLTIQPVWHDVMHIVVGKKHPLAKLKKVKVSDLLSEAAILTDANTFTRNLVQQALGVNSDAINISLETNYLESIKMMVSIGLGWSALPATMLSPDLTTISIPGIKILRLLGVAYHQQRTLSSAASAFLDVLLKIKN